MGDGDLVFKCVYTTGEKIFAGSHKNHIIPGLSGSKICRTPTIFTPGWCESLVPVICTNQGPNSKNRENF
jgi:hypothetical protein